MKTKSRIKINFKKQSLERLKQMAIESDKSHQLCINDAVTDGLKRLDVGVTETLQRQKAHYNVEVENLKKIDALARELDCEPSDLINHFIDQYTRMETIA